MPLAEPLGQAGNARALRNRMSTPTRYRSSIPSNAKERVLSFYSSGAKREAEYRQRRRLVGRRGFFPTGELEYEQAYKNGKPHGLQFDWHSPGRLLSVERWVDGVPHGTTRQWARNGTLLGTYRMIRGSGIDLWRGERPDGTPFLSEVRYLRQGAPYGFEWWINEDQQSVYIERHWSPLGQHGIERQWNASGRLRRGYPKYHVKGVRVTKRQYLAARSADPSLPPFLAEDNQAVRRFPPQIAKHLVR
jgi:hypothetical protein